MLIHITCYSSGLGNALPINTQIRIGKCIRGLIKYPRKLSRSLEDISPSTASFSLKIFV